MRDSRRKPEEGGDDVKSAWSLWPGLHTRYNGRYNGSPHREVELILKAGLSSDRSLQLDSVKVELLVTAGQPYCGEYVPGALYTPPVTSWESATLEVG